MTTNSTTCMAAASAGAPKITPPPAAKPSDDEARAGATVASTDTTTPSAWVPSCLLAVPPVSTVCPVWPRISAARIAAVGVIALDGPLSSAPLPRIGRPLVGISR